MIPTKIRKTLRHVTTMIFATVLTMPILTYPSLASPVLRRSATYLRRRHQSPNNPPLSLLNSSSSANNANDFEVREEFDYAGMNEEMEVTEDNSEFFSQCKIVYDTGMELLGWHMDQFRDDRDTLEEMLRWGNASSPEFEAQQQHMEQVCANHRLQVSRVGIKMWNVLDEIASYLGLQNTEDLDTQLNDMEADIRILQEQVKAKIIRVRLRVE